MLVHYFHFKSGHVTDSSVASTSRPERPPQGGHVRGTGGQHVTIAIIIPPAGLDDVQASAAQGTADGPRSLRKVTQFFTDAVRQLEINFGAETAPNKTRQGVRIQAGGARDAADRSQPRPLLHQAQDTCRLLLSTLAAGGITTFQRFIRKYTGRPPFWPSVVMTEAHSAMSVQGRGSLCKWLRGLRGHK